MGGINGCGMLTIMINTDDFPEETTWNVVRKEDDVLVGSGTPGDNNGTQVANDSGLDVLKVDVNRNALFEWQVCVDRPGTYIFKIIDTYGDGICCQNGSGSFELKLNGNTILNGDGVFESEFKHELDIAETDISSIGSDGEGADAQQNIEQACQTFVVQIKTDDFPEETTWNLYNGHDTVAIFSGTPGDEFGKRVQREVSALSRAIDRNAVFEWEVCVQPGTYRWEIRDTFGDGICCANGNGSFELRLDGDVLFSGDGSFEATSVHFFDIQTQNIAETTTQPNTNTETVDTEDVFTGEQPDEEVVPLSCAEQVLAISGPEQPLICYADMGRAGFDTGFVFNESPVVQSCFMMRGQGQGVSVDSIEGSVFSYISDQVRSVALNGDKTAQILSIDNSDILSPGSRDFTVMMWVKVLPQNFASGIWIAAHGNAFKNKIGWSIHATKNQVRFRVNDGQAFGKKILFPLHDGQWHHIALVVDRSGSGKLHAYLDGSEMLDRSIPGAGSGQDDLVTAGGSMDMSSEEPFVLGLRVNPGNFILHYLPILEI